MEVDRERLSELLTFWEKAKKAEFGEGISFMQGMRLLAGAGIGTKEEFFSRDTHREWMRVDAGAWLRPLLDDLRSPEKIGSSAPGSALGTTLRPYQQVGVDWLWFLYRLGLGACLADDMGLGKTIQVLALLLLIRKTRNEGAERLRRALPAGRSRLARGQLEGRDPPLCPVAVRILRPSLRDGGHGAERDGESGSPDGSACRRTW